MRFAPDGAPACCIGLTGIQESRVGEIPAFDSRFRPTKSANLIGEKLDRRKSAKGGSLPAADSQRAKNTLMIKLNRAESGSIPCVTGWLCATPFCGFTAKKRSEQSGSSDTSGDQRQGRQPVNERRVQRSDEN